MNELNEEIKELRKSTGLSQRDFAKLFEIPVNTLQCWEQSRRTPPKYVVFMLRTLINMHREILKRR
jgi:putative transcriptional regulator